MRFLLRIHLVLLFLFSWNSFSKAPNLFTHIPCTNQTLEAISNFGTPLNWKKDSKAIVRSALESGGVIKVQVLGEEESLLKVSNASIEATISFKMPKCNMKLLKSKYVGLGFTDENLKDLMEKNKKGIILVWSPYMS